MANFESLRSSQRRPLGLMVKSRVQSRVVYVNIIDISEGGCKIKGSSGFAEVGDRITMRVGQVNAPLGTVAWVIGKEAGVAFNGEMHPAVLDYLCESSGVDLSDDRKHFMRV